MAEKRFFILKDEEFKDVLSCIRDKNSKIKDIYGHYKYDDIEQICLFLNEQNDEIEMLKSKLEDCEFAHRTEMAHHRVIEKDLKKENEELRNKKERYKRLSEIRQQQIDNRILTIKEFINNCSDNKVKSTLKELFYLEVNEYDLSSEKRKLLNENEQLNKKLQIYKSDGLETLNDLQRCYDNAKKSMKRIDVLEEENEQLKQDGFYWAETAEARRKEIDKLRKDNSILKQQRDYLFDVIDDVFPHSGSTRVYNRMKNIGDVE